MLITHELWLGAQVSNLNEDLADGVRLMALLEVLTGCRLQADDSIEPLASGAYTPSPLVNPEPRYRSEKLANVKLCLELWRLVQQQQQQQRSGRRRRMRNVGARALCAFGWSPAIVQATCCTS